VTAFAQKLRRGKCVKREARKAENFTVSLPEARLEKILAATSLNGLGQDGQTQRRGEAQSFAEREV
jgi:hypothetical protein